MSISARSATSAARTCSTSASASDSRRSARPQPPPPARRARSRAPRAAAADPAARRPLDDRLSLDGQVLVYLLAVVIVALVGGVIVARRCGGRRGAADQLLLRRAGAHADVARSRPGRRARRVRRRRGARQRRGRARGPARAGGRAGAGRGRDALGARPGADLDERASRCTRCSTSARETFGMESVALKVREPRQRRVARRRARRLGARRASEAPLRFDVPIGPRLRLVGRGPALFAEDQRVLDAFAARGARPPTRAGGSAARPREARALAAVDRAAHRAARRGRPRPAHAAGRDQGGGQQPAPDRRRVVGGGARRAARDDRGLGRPARRASSATCSTRAGCRPAR